MDFIGYRTLKTVIGTVLSMYIAAHFDLKYASAAGIITILSLQSTRKQSLRFAGKMFGAFLLALIVATLLFTRLGYTPLVFGLFLLLFIPLSVRFNVQQGIVVSAVLVSQLLIEKTNDVSFIINQISLMGIGVSIAFFLHLYVPSFERKIKEEQAAIETMFRQILLNMAYSLREQVVSIKEQEHFTRLEASLQQGREFANKNSNNSFSSNAGDYSRYMSIRSQQFYTLQRMRKHFERLSFSYTQTHLIADFTSEVAETFLSTPNEKKLAALNKLRTAFTTMDLPQNRAEFENRGMLYQFLNDMEEFLRLESGLK